MFTVKLFRGTSPDPQDPRAPSATMLMEARTIEVRPAVAGRHIVINPGQQDEHHAYVLKPDDATPEDWSLAVIENAAGKTTEVVRP